MASKEKILSDNALLVTKDRYFMTDENWDNLSFRVGGVAATVESDQKKYKELFSEVIYNQLFLPGGRILRNAGRPKGSLFNCYVLPIGDSIEEIADFYKKSLILWSEGGGIGCNFTPLRPKGDKILGKGGNSSGLVSFIQASNDISMVVESGGSRRAAALGLCDVYHPEVLDYIDAKLEIGKISQYNISVGIDNKFIEAVEADTEWTFKFKQREYGSMPARKIWSKIVKNMLNCAEPGLLNLSNLYKNNSYSFAPISSTNPCGEVPLENYGVCCLGSLVLPNFITGNVNTNWKKLEDTIKIAVRFLDNIIDINTFVLRENDIAAHNSRRIGLGVLGLAEFLYAKKIKYGSEKSFQEVERLMRFIRDKSYEASVELAMEKGSFPKFDPVAYGKASFVRKLPASLRMLIKKNGIRNVTLNAIAPTGTISQLADCTGGIEPLFSKAYERKDKISSRIIVHQKLQEYIEENSGADLPDWFVDSFDLKPEEHLEMQSVVQQYVDSSVSKTINLPQDTTEEELSEWLLTYMPNLKGTTVYKDGTMESQVYNRISYEDAVKFVLEKKASSNLNGDDFRCRNGVCDL